MIQWHCIIYTRYFWARHYVTSEIEECFLRSHRSCKNKTIQRVFETSADQVENFTHSTLACEILKMVEDTLSVPHPEKSLTVEASSGHIGNESKLLGLCVHRICVHEFWRLPSRRNVTPCSLERHQPRHEPWEWRYRDVGVDAWPSQSLGSESCRVSMEIHLSHILKVLRILTTLWTSLNCLLFGFGFCSICIERSNPIHRTQGAASLKTLSPEWFIMNHLNHTPLLFMNSTQCPTCFHVHDPRASKVSGTESRNSQDSAQRASLGICTVRMDVRRHSWCIYYILLLCIFIYSFHLTPLN